MDPIAEQLIARLRKEPGDSAAYEGLKAHYQHGGDWASLANLLEGWAGTNLQDWENAAQAYAEAAESVLRGSGDSARAAALYRLALQSNLLHAEAGAKLLALLEQAGDPQALSEFLDSYARALDTAGGQPEYVASIYQRLAQLWATTFERPDVAAPFEQRAAELLGEPARPASSDGDTEAMVAERERLLATEQDPARRSALLSELGQLRAERLDDLAGGIQALRQALSETPGDIAVMHQLATYLLKRAHATDAEAARTDLRRVAELFYQIAQGVDEGEALPFLQSALEATPDHDGALALLERLAPARGQGEILARYWVNFVAVAGEGPEADQRRLMLAQAYLSSDQVEDAVYCLQPAAAHGNEKAHELLQTAYARQARDAPAPIEAPAQTGDPSRSTTARPPPRRDDDARSRNHAQLTALRKEVHDALAARRHDDAAAHCKALLEIEPTDTEAFNLLESHYRKRRDYPSLRDLLLASTRMPGLAIDARKMRLREIATLSEGKLRDADGATSAWRGVVTLDPADREAIASLKRLLKKAQQWDELATVLEREALATTVLEDKAALIHEIALIHRDKRNDPHETAEALRQLHALKPEDAAVRDELCELLVTLELWADAAPLLQERVDTAKDEFERHKLSSQLAAVLHEHLHDLDAAFEVCEQMLKAKPNDKAVFDRMERIAEAGNDYPRLLGLLERRALLAAKAERPALFTRMGAIAEEQLRDVEKAAEYFGDALDLAPDDPDALKRLVDMFERAGDYPQLIELLRERILLEREAKNRAPLHRRLAQILSQRQGDEVGATESYRKLLEIEEDDEALRYLREGASRDGDARELADVLRRLVPFAKDVHERADLMLELAVLLHERLGSAGAREASTTLQRLVEELDPSLVAAIELLATISEELSDEAGLAVALERKLALETDKTSRIALAKRLADLFEHKLHDHTRAITALQAWNAAASDDAEPRRRLRALLERTERWPELLATLDGLAEWEPDFDARDEATIAAARVAAERLGDSQGAWKRLVPLVEERNEQAEQALREVARSSGGQAELAALYVRLAQQTEDSSLAGLLWGRASEVFEQELADPAQAFEASLRMLASDLGNRKVLAQVDQLAARTKAYKRLAQVYDRLLKQAEDDAEKVELLRRHADLLQEDQQEEALDRILRACALAPQDEALLSRAEELAQRTKRSEELLVVYDRGVKRARSEREQVRLLLRAARLCDGALRDRDRANLSLKSALAAAGASAELAAEVESAAKDLDEQRPELGAESVRRALVRSHREVAERAEPAAAVRLLLRGAELLDQELQDERGAFELLRGALSLQPKSDEVYAGLVALAEKQKRLDAIDALLARLVDETIESAATVALLRRRGALLEGPLNRFQDAAAVYSKLLQLRPDDPEAAEKLHASLRHSGRHQDLLLALNKQLQRTREPGARIGLLRAIASTWETALKNRWEALDAWKAVLREAPDAADAASAVQRLERGRGLSTAELDLEGGEPETGVSSASAAAAAAAVEAEASDTQQVEAIAKEPPEAEVHAREDDTERVRTEPHAPEPVEAAPLAPEAVAPAPEQQPPSSSAEERAPEPSEPEAAALETAAAPLATDAPPRRRGRKSRAPKTPPPEPPPPEPAPQQAVDDDDGGLEALDAAVGGTVEEIDLLDDNGHAAHDVFFDDATPAAPSAPPPPPPVAAKPRPALPALAPPPSRMARVSAPPPPLPPTRGSRPSAPNEASAADAPTPQSGPPQPPGKRSASVPPPLPTGRSASQPPPLPPSRK